MERIKLYRIELCVFQRHPEAKWEKGILLNEGVLGILDKYGKIVDYPYYWERRSEFALDIGVFLD